LAADTDRAATAVAKSSFFMGYLHFTILVISELLLAGAHNGIVTNPQRYNV